MKVLLWAVQRLIGGLSHIGAERDIAACLHVVLPGSPNRGMFGGDGAYGEAKSALDAVVTRWKAETSWAQRVSLAHALIGWTKGTGLMGHNDAIVGAVEEAGVTTYTTDEMARMLLDLCDIESKVAAAREPLQADLTGALADADLDMAELAAKAREEMLARPERRGRRHQRARNHPRATVAAARLPGGAAACLGRPRRRPGRPGGDRRRCRARARTARRGPASRWRSTTSCRQPVCSSWPGRPVWSSGKTIPRRAGTTPRPVTWSTRASWSSATTT